MGRPGLRPRVSYPTRHAVSYEGPVRYYLEADAKSPYVISQPASVWQCNQEGWEHYGRLYTQQHLAEAMRRRLPHPLKRQAEVVKVGGYDGAQRLVMLSIVERYVGWILDCTRLGDQENRPDIAWWTQGWLERHHIRVISVEGAVRLVAPKLDPVFFVGRAMQNLQRYQEYWKEALVLT